MHNVFISYHHQNDQNYKDILVKLGEDVVIDKSVDTGDISDDLTDEAIRQKIRDEYLRDSTVTIVLAGMETRNRKHVDWEIYSSMIDGKRNKRSGVLVVNLHSDYTIAHGETEQSIYSDALSWSPIGSRAKCAESCPLLPDRILDNFTYISVIPWSSLTAGRLEFLVDATFKRKDTCEYDFSTPMRRRNS